MINVIAQLIMINEVKKLYLLVMDIDLGFNSHKYAKNAKLLTHTVSMIYTI